MRNPLVRVPLNGDLNCQICFENEFDFVSAYDCSRLDVAKTLSENRIHRVNNLNCTPIIGENCSRILDHYCLYKTRNGKLYFVSQPYIGKPLSKYMFEGVNYPFEEMVSETAKWCREEGLNLEIRVPGPHNPGTTMFIISKNDEQQPPLLTAQDDAKAKANAKRAEYYREWRKKNPEKTKEYIRRYWEKKALKEGEEK